VPHSRSQRRAGLLGLAVAVLLVGAPVLSAEASVGIGPSPLPLPPPPSAAPAPPPPPDPNAVGGPRMGEHGVVVERVTGVPALPSDKDVTAKSWLVADLDTGAVLAAKDPHLRNRPASTIKTLTALALIPQLDAKHGRAPYTKAEQELIRQPDGLSTAIGLEPGRAYPINRLFEAMLVASANDAAEALAAAAPGGRAGTLTAMNAAATHLQALDTHAGSPSGLDATGQFTSAYDLALIARAALALPDFTAYDGAKTVMLVGSHGVFGGYNHNRLLNSYPGAYAGKDGYTSLSGQVWWGAAQRGGHRLLVVVVGAGARPTTQEITLLDWGFKALPKAVPVGALVGAAVPGQAAPSATLPAGVPTAGLVPPAVRAARAAGPGGAPGWLLGLGAVAVAGVGLLLAGRRRQSRRMSSRRRRSPTAPLGAARRAPTGLGSSASVASGAVKIVPRKPAPDPDPAG